MSLTSSPPRITPRHLQALLDSAITESDAKAWGIYSVLSSDELPPDLATHPEARGLVFPLRQGDGSVIHQIALDEPMLDGSRYLQPDGTGAIINVPECMAARVGVADKILVVEGTKQTVAACQYSPEDTLVVGIQGCRGFSRHGAPLEGWADLINQTANVTIILRADWARDRDSWAWAAELKATFEGITSGSVRVASPPESSNWALDDALGFLAPRRRKKALQEVIRLARSGVGAQPARQSVLAVRAPSDVEVNWEAAEIQRALGRNRAGDPQPPTVVAQFAARVVRVECHIDETGTGELVHPPMLTLEVALRPNDGPRVVHRVRIPSSRLAFTGEWLDRLPGGVGPRIPRSFWADDVVANAIRQAASSVETISILARWGWYRDLETDHLGVPGVWRWCFGTGAIGLDGKVGHLRGKPTASDFQSIDLPDPSAITKEVARASVRNFVLSRDLFLSGSRLPWDAAVAGWAISFSGITPNAAIAYFGPPSSGKSTIAQAIASTLSPAWAPSGNPMATFNARPAGMDLLLNGTSHCFVHVDDLKPVADGASMRSALKAFDGLLRRAHGSGGAVRGTVEKDSGELGVRSVDRSTPFVIVTGEEIPTGGSFAESGLDRVLTIPVQPKSLFGDSREGLDELGRRASSGEFRKVTALYLQWLAGRIAERNGPSVNRFGSWTDSLEARRSQELTSLWQGKTGRELEPISDRARMLAASLGLGMSLVLEFAADIGALDELETEAIREAFAANIVAAVVEHSRSVMGGNRSPAKSALAVLRSAVSSRQVALLPFDGATQSPIIGERMRLPSGDAIIAINVEAAATALHFSGGGRALIRALESVALLNSKGATTRTLQVNGERVQVVCIPVTVWDDAEEEVDSVAPE